MFSSVTVSSVSSAAAMQGGAAFFAPETRTVPTSGLPPRITNLSMESDQTFVPVAGYKDKSESLWMGWRVGLPQGNSLPVQPLIALRMLPLAALRRLAASFFEQPVLSMMSASGTLLPAA